MSLLELTVRDLALIERARVPFGPGLVVVTGETGAGKSLLIDALGLVLGGRADSGLVRSGAGSARVEALFERPGDESGEPLICAREVAANGRSVARLDDETVTAGRLAEVVGPLVEIHGQHEQQRLLSAGWQRDLLDAYGGHGALRAALAEAVGVWRENAAALERLTADPRELARRLELLDHEAEEIAAAALREGEAEELQAALSAAANLEQIHRLGGAVREALAGEGSGARDALARAERDAAELARLDDRFGSLAEQLTAAVAEVEELAAELRRRLDGVDRDPAELTALEERLGRIHSLERKYGGDLAAVLEHGRRAAADAARLRDLETERAARRVEAERQQAEARRISGELHDARLAAAERLGAAVSEALQELGFRQAAFSVRIEPAPLEASGGDAVAYVVAPNPGEPPLPLARIASGGELSRISLAIKQVLAWADTTPTLVFDEIDAGIGGRSADAIGRSLWRLARDHQVVCVTHLPQIAAYADRHLQIAKQTRQGRTLTEVRELGEPERLEELAQMLSGSTGGPAALDAARELLGRAAAARSQPVGAR